MLLQVLPSTLRNVGCWSARDAAQLLRRFAVETDGQDLIEYALLTTFIGFAGAAAWAAVQTGLGIAYSGFNLGVWNLWEPADPVGGGS
jgi:Flp pilus assembly pilin Flp